MKKKLYMVGSAHLDPVWMWQWYEGYHEALSTYRSALDRMREYPDFVFTGCSAAYYHWVEETDPEMFREIQARIREGRWVLAGGWWIQPDCNIPSGESFVRQALYAQRWFFEKFGVTAKVGFNVDSFGHTGALPQILKKSGLSAYVFTRPSPPEKGLPAELFLWESDDGTRIPAFRILHGYGTGGGDIERDIRLHVQAMDDNMPVSMCFYGVGNHGGGPTKKNIESILRLRRDGELPELVFAAPDAFFEDVENRELPLPVVHDDLFHHASGCYASHSRVKAQNRKAEYRLLAAEGLSVLAETLTGRPYPADFKTAWTNVLFNQFHDIMGGTSLREAYEDAGDQQREALSAASRSQNRAAQALAWRIGIPHEDGTHPIVVFNPNAFPVKMPVEILVTGFDCASGRYRLLDDLDTEIPAQTCVREFKSSLCFIADLPALGYRTYRLVPGTPADFPAVEADGFTLCNGRFRLGIDGETGAVTSFVRLETDENLFSEPSAVPMMYEDGGDTWGHRYWVYDNHPAGSFEMTGIRLLEQGPVHAAVRVSYALGHSTLTRDLILYRDIDRVDIRVRTDWHEQNRMLKILFYTSYINERCSVSAPFGHTLRPVDGVEFPMHEWLDLSGVASGGSGLSGLSFLNDGRYSYSVRNNCVGLTVLRSPIYAQHNPTKPVPGRYYHYMDQGVSELCIGLYPHVGGLQNASVQKEAVAFNSPPFSLFATYHDGPLPQSFSYGSCSAENIVPCCVKKAEDGGGMILRAYEAAKRRTEGCRFTLHGGRTFEADFGVNEIKTFYIPEDGDMPVYEVNLIEYREETY